MNLLSRDTGNGSVVFKKSLKIEISLSNAQPNVRPSVRPSVHLAIHLPSVMSVLHPSVHWLACLYFIVLSVFFLSICLTSCLCTCSPPIHPAYEFDEFALSSIHYASLLVSLSTSLSAYHPTYMSVYMPSCLNNS